MGKYTRIVNGNSSIESAVTFCDAVNAIGLLDATKFSDIFTCAENLIRSENANVSISALANVRGAWYEWLIAIIGRNFAANNECSLLLKLPNVMSFDSTTLYQNKYVELISDFKEKLKQTSNVNLITSNPDFVILDRKLLNVNLDEVTLITPSVLGELQNDYLKYVNSSDLNGIKGYLATKSSLRPDRRIQLLHEGSLMKAIYTHMQTRLWISDATGIKYHAASLAVGAADLEGLRSVATHSIISATSKPEPAVDSISSVSCGGEAIECFHKILF